MGLCAGPDRREEDDWKKCIEVEDWRERESITPSSSSAGSRDLGGCGRDVAGPENSTPPARTSPLLWSAIEGSGLEDSGEEGRSAGVCGVPSASSTLRWVVLIVSWGAGQLPER